MRTVLRVLSYYDRLPITLLGLLGSRSNSSRTTVCKGGFYSSFSKSRFLRQRRPDKTSVVRRTRMSSSLDHHEGGDNCSRRHQHQHSSKSYPIPVTTFTSIRQIAPSLREAAPDLALIEVDNDALSRTAGEQFDASRLKPSTLEKLAQAEILITEPAVLAKILAIDDGGPTCSAPSLLPNLKWCQSTWAGVDPLFRLERGGRTAERQRNAPSPPFALTRFAGKFGLPIAEWCLARIVAHERQFDQSALDQSNGAWPASRDCRVFNYRYLKDLTLVVLGGCGDIGSCIARAASQAFGMRTVGFTLTQRNEIPDGLDEIVYDIDDALRKADYLVSVLPSTAETRGLLSGDALSAAGKAKGGQSPVFLNVGRGDVSDEESIIHALDSGYISAAILDVFETEPLPKDSRLWQRPDFVVSPHVSAVTRGQDVPEIFLENYCRYITGEPLKFNVDWEKGY